MNIQHLMSMRGYDIFEHPGLVSELVANDPLTRPTDRCQIRRIRELPIGAPERSTYASLLLRSFVHCVEVTVLGRCILFSEVNVNLGVETPFDYTSDITDCHSPKSSKSSFPVNMSSEQVPFPPPGEYLKAVRKSSRAARLRANITVSHIIIARSGMNMLRR